MKGPSHGTAFPYPLELRRRAVRMVAEVRDDCPTETAVLQAVAEKLGIGSRETLRNWLKQHEIDAGRRPGTTTEESAQLKALKKENAELMASRVPLQDITVEVVRRNPDDEGKGFVP